MDSVKYIGMDVHKEAISIAVLNSSGKLVMESIIETREVNRKFSLRARGRSKHEIAKRTQISPVN